MTKQDMAIQVMTQAGSDLSDIILKDMTPKLMWREVTRIETSVDDMLRELTFGEVTHPQVEAEHRLFRVTMREVMEGISEMEHS